MLTEMKLSNTGGTGCHFVAFDIDHPSLRLAETTKHKAVLTPGTAPNFMGDVNYRRRSVAGINRSR